MSSRRIVVVGASSGGIEALRTLAAALPANFAAPIGVVLHTAPQSPGTLDGILRRAGTMSTVFASDGERLRDGRIYVAPPDRHLVIEPGVVRLTRGPKENRFRPAIDPLFRSAAQVYGPGAIGVVLTGSLDDGTAGLVAIKQLGGLAIVQDPQDAMFPSMPRNALRYVRADYCVPLVDIGPTLMRLVTHPVEQREGVMVPKEMEIEVDIAKERNALDAGVMDIAEPSSFACPECHGVLLRLKHANPARFRCHTGHAYSAESLIAALDEEIEETLWGAVRALQESKLLLEHLSNYSGSQDPTVAEDFRARAAELHRQARVVSDVVTEREALKPLA